MLDLPQQLNADLNLLHVKSDIEYTDNFYYLTLDGSKSFDDENVWNITFDGFNKFGEYVLAKYRVKVTDTTVINKSCVKYCLGSVLDFLS